MVKDIEGDEKKRPVLTIYKYLFLIVYVNVKHDFFNKKNQCKNKKMISPLLSGVTESLKKLCAEEKREDIPGERELGERFSVGRGTIRKALEILEEEGWISPASSTRPRSIEKGLDTSRKSLIEESTIKKVGFLTSVPLNRLSRETAEELLRLGKVLSQEGTMLHIEEGHWSANHRPEKELAKLVLHEQCCCWILYRTSEQTQLWFRRRSLPVLVRGISYERAALPQLDTHWKAVSRHAAANLWRQGHRRAGICISEELLKGNQLMREGFCKTKLPEWNPVVISVPRDITSFQDNLEKSIREYPDLSAFVTTRADQIIPLLSWMNFNPVEEKKVLSLVYESYMNDWTLPIDFYRNDARKTVRHLVRMIRALNENRQVRDHFFLPEYQAAR